MTALYNEIDTFAARWLDALMCCGHITQGKIEPRSIADVRGPDLQEYERVHLFAGIAGWDYALRLAGWPAGRFVWTGSCPCQRFSTATRGRKTSIDWWPQMRRLIDECRPATVFGEQVASARLWFDSVCNDYEALGYSIWAAVLPAWSVGSDHRRRRIYYAAYTNSNSEPRCTIYEEMAQLPWDFLQYRALQDTHGLPRCVAGLHAYGSAIVPQVAAEFVRAFLDVEELLQESAS